MKFVIQYLTANNNNEKKELSLGPSNTGELGGYKVPSSGKSNKINKHTFILRALKIYFFVYKTSQCQES